MHQRSSQKYKMIEEKIMHTLMHPSSNLDKVEKGKTIFDYYL